jgi:serine/threonine protein kinase
LGKRIGNYRIRAKIGSGGYGSVYIGEHTILTGRTVAIKMLHTRYLNVKKERYRFMEEARLLEKLKHPRILPIIDVGIHKGSLYIVTEYAPGGSLHDLLQRLYPHHLTIEEAIIILTQIGEALDFAHQQNIIHCDLKPANILFNTSGKAVIADFGNALVLASKNFVLTSTVTGTLAYMAPERFQGVIHKASDLYSLGCIAYQLFTGATPFHAQNDTALRDKHLYEKPVSPTRMNPQLPTYIEQAVLKAMAKNPAERYRDVLSFITALHPPQRANASNTSRKQEEYLLEVGNNCYSLGRNSDALAAYNQAIWLDPNLAAAHNGRANVLYRLGRHGGALVAYNQAIWLDPNLAAAHNGRANVLYRLGRYEEALAASKRAHRIDLDSTAVYSQQNLAIEQLRPQRRLYRLSSHRI